MRRALASFGSMLAGFACAGLLLLVGPVDAAAFDRMVVTYGLREYAEYDDNLFFAVEGEPKISDVAINTAPDLSFLYDDGKTRLLGRASYRRESFIDNREGSGNYYSFSGEFSRLLTDQVSFSLLGGYTNYASLQQGQVLQEPGQRNVIRPIRGAVTEGTVFSPSLSVFWSRRFGTSLTYEDNQSFTEGGLGQIGRSIALNGFYGLSRRTTLRGFLVAQSNRNSRLPLVERSDTDSFAARFGFQHTFSPRLTAELSAGPQWTKDVNTPRNVTVLYNGITEVVVDPVLGLTAPAYVSEPGKKVEDTSLGLSFSLQMSYQLDKRTNLALFAAQGTTSGQGAAGTQLTQELQLTASRHFGSKWNLSVRGAWQKQSSVTKDVSILFFPVNIGGIVVQSPDPITGEFAALDRRSFDINARL
ncbi:MAG: hypothetical protein Q8R92_17820, partial [Deltaproteobacteria bacterium]|nr:hypothetical protein [Deltaproteobacteria bacterium]